MTHSYETWLIHTPVVSNAGWSRRIYTTKTQFIWDMTHSYETWLIHMRHDSSIHLWYQTQVDRGAFILSRSSHALRRRRCVIPGSLGQSKERGYHESPHTMNLRVGECVGVCSSVPLVSRESANIMDPLTSWLSSHDESPHTMNLRAEELIAFSPDLRSSPQDKIDAYLFHVSGALLIFELSPGYPDAVHPIKVESRKSNPMSVWGIVNHDGWGYFSRNKLPKLNAPPWVACRTACRTTNLVTRRMIRVCALYTCRRCSLSH